ncbi:MAG: Holliday junction resolvase RuvX [Candidatus Gracilibacteria bacterium]|nr:Holliday junction resolvase RuvX [Candidatus Gracilibacteria bacterium]
MYLSIDLGDKRCGIAIAIDGIVFPKDIILRPKLLSVLKKYIAEYKIKTIVIGLPYDLYGKKTKQLEKTKRYMENLKTNFPEIQVEGVDERFTSFEADNICLEMGDDSKRDDIAAALILETYLDQKN